MAFVLTDGVPQLEGWGDERALIIARLAGDAVPLGCAKSKLVAIRLPSVSVE